MYYLSRTFISIFTHKKIEIIFPHKQTRKKEQMEKYKVWNGELGQIKNRSAHEQTQCEHTTDSTLAMIVKNLITS